MSQNQNEAERLNNLNPDEVLQKFNEHLASMNVKHRWTSLEEITVKNQFNWQQVIKSKEGQQALLWILIANLRMGLIPFLANSTTLLVTVVYYGILNLYVIVEDYKEKQPAIPAFIQSFIKEATMLAIIIIGLENYYLGLELPPFIKNYSGIFFMVLLFLKVNSFSDLSLTIKLATKIFIAGKDWKITRLAMMNPKAEKLHQYFVEVHATALSLKKNK